MIYLFSLFFSLLNPNEINIANSLDWLCYNSGTVATVKVTSIKEENFKLLNYESNVTVSATITKLYKGSEPDHKEIIIYSRLTYIGYDKWKDVVGQEVLVFLKDLMCESQCAYGIWDDDRGMIPMAGPGVKALTGDFNLLLQPDDILKYATDKIEKMKGKKAEQRYLEVPYETDAFGVLYAGSACYLIVPDILYPKATKGMN